MLLFCQASSHAQVRTWLQSCAPLRLEENQDRMYVCAACTIILYYVYGNTRRKVLYVSSGVINNALCTYKQTRSLNPLKAHSSYVYCIGVLYCSRGGVKARKDPFVPMHAPTSVVCCLSTVTARSDGFFNTSVRSIFSPTRHMHAIHDIDVDSQSFREGLARRKLSRRR